MQSKKKKRKFVRIIPNERVLIKPPPPQVILKGKKDRRGKDFPWLNRPVGKTYQGKRGGCVTEEFPGSISRQTKRRGENHSENAGTHPKKGKVWKGNLHPETIQKRVASKRGEKRPPGNCGTKEKGPKDKRSPHAMWEESRGGGDEGASRESDPDQVRRARKTGKRTPLTSSKRQRSPSEELLPLGPGP